MRRDVAHRVRVFAAHWRLLSGAALLQLAAACSLRIRPLPRVREAGRRVRPLLEIALPGTEDDVVWALNATGRRLRGLSTCLVRAIAAEMRLSSSTRPLYLVIGVKRTPAGILQSHAWLRDRERVLMGGPMDAGFTPIAEWGSAA